MSSIHKIAQLLVSCWQVSDQVERPSIPTSHGVLDEALQRLCSERVLPEWVCDNLNFAKTRVGLQCVELPALLRWAQFAELTEAPNPSYQRTVVTASKFVALRLLQRLDVEEDDAVRWGRALHRAVDEAMAARYHREALFRSQLAAADIAAPA